ncbi:MAG: hypothetical protein ACTHJ3_16565, partial [Pararhizobium sp.]
MKHEHDRQWTLPEQDQPGAPPDDVVVPMIPLISRSRSAASERAREIARQDARVEEAIREIEKATADLVQQGQAGQTAASSAYPTARDVRRIDPRRRLFAAKQPDDAMPERAPDSGAAGPAARAAPAPAATAETPSEAAAAPTAEMKTSRPAPSMLVIDGDTGPLRIREEATPKAGGPGDGGSGGDKGNGGGGGGNQFHKRAAPVNFVQSLHKGLRAVRRNLLIVLAFTIANNILVLA